MKKTVMIVPVIAAILFIIVSINIQTNNDNQKSSGKTSEFRTNTINNYNSFVKISHEVEEVIDSFQDFFNAYLENVFVSYDEYYKKLDTLKIKLTDLDTHVQALNELCNIPLEDDETTKICENYNSNYDKIKNSYNKLVETFNETITNYNNLAKYRDDLEEKTLYK